MSERDTEKTGAMWRLAFVALVIVVCLSAIACRLHSIQVVSTSAYRSSQQKQSVRRVLMPAVRGKIFDRDGVCLADNRPSYCIAIYVEELRRPGKWENTINAVDKKVDDLSLKLNIPRQITRDDIARHIRRQLPLPLLAWQDVDAATLARFSELVTPTSGMDVYVEPERLYPLGKAAGHLLGYVGRDKPDAVTNEVFHYNIMGMKGRSGVEQARNDALSGFAGGKLITVDVSGYRHSETNRPPIPGKDIHLTVSSRLQSLIERELGNRRAAVVAVDPNNGDILALASEPSYDPNEMSPRVTAKLWKELQNDPNRPLFNRALTGTYPPGSTFKPAVALAALKADVSPGYSVDCTGVYTLGGMKLRCAARQGHGPGITMRKAIEHSCNPYFCTLGVAIGYDAVRDEARAMGFGTRTGIGLFGEAAGLLPTDEWKRRTQKAGWRGGDTANISIGQGYLLVTPLQLAMFASVLANGGTLYKPRLYKDEPVSISSELNIPAQDLAVVRGGMFDVVNAERGGGRHARVKGIEIAAKTGTAEYGPRSNRKKYTWMIAFAPYDKPSIAVAVLVEDGESGGLTAAPIVSKVIAEYFNVKEKVEIEHEGVSEYHYEEPATAEPEPATEPTTDTEPNLNSPQQAEDSQLSTLNTDQTPNSEFRILNSAPAAGGAE